MPSPLFNRFNRAVQQQARAAFQQSPLGQAVGIMNNARARGVVSLSAYSRLRNTLKQSGSPDAILKSLGGAGFGDAVREVEKYARGAFWNQFLGALGPIGQLVGALMRPTGEKTSDLDSEIESAKRFLEAFGYNVTKKPNVKATPFGPRAPHGPLAQRTEAINDVMEAQGFTLQPPPDLPPQSPIPIPRSNKIRVPGLPQDLSPNDPVVTGEMIPVTSSNVHSIGYILNPNNAQKGTLKIRFWQKLKGQKNKKPGPLYYYYLVPVWVFDDFRKAASKGKFVWDNVRIRGTTAGHRYRYSLKGIAQGYVPRRATIVGGTKDGDEYLMQRRGRVNGRTVVSQLPNQRLGRYEPNRGTRLINRGK